MINILNIWILSIESGMSSFDTNLSLVCFFIFQVVISFSFAPRFFSANIKDYLWLIRLGLLHVVQNLTKGWDVLLFKLWLRVRFVIGRSNSDKRGRLLYVQILTKGWVCRMFKLWQKVEVCYRMLKVSYRMFKY